MQNETVRYTINNASLSGLERRGNTPVLKLHDQATGEQCVLPISEEAANEVNVSAFSAFDVEITLTPRPDQKRQPQQRSR